MATRYFYAEVGDTIYAFTREYMRDYYAWVYSEQGGRSIYKKDVVKKLGKNLAFSWSGCRAKVDRATN